MEPQQCLEKFENIIRAMKEKWKKPKNYHLTWNGMTRRYSVSHKTPNSKYACSTTLQWFEYSYYRSLQYDDQ